MDSELDNLIIDQQAMDEKLIEIDATKSFLHQYPIDISSSVSYQMARNFVQTSRIGHLSESTIIVNCKGTIVYTTACSKLRSITI